MDYFIYRETDRGDSVMTLLVHRMAATDKTDETYQDENKTLFCFEKTLCVADITRALHSAGLIAVPRNGIYEIKRRKK